MILRSKGIIGLSLVACVTLSGCQTTKSSPSFSLFGGHKTSASASIIEALQGGIVGRTGVTLSNSDRQRALEAEYRALEGAAAGQAVAWSGRNVSGKVVASAPYQVGSQNCRQYSHTLTIDGKETLARGSACRNGDGSWSPLG
ncbi:hypothetical protein [Rhizobium metallidurans]|uniref:hypothetical protein n=1 Tax=Rhizobium metallidurans TaxID=1265931 RepID=UPI001621F21F|nr:hypothetical protein [Rhizobium metallidurans]